MNSVTFCTPYRTTSKSTYMKKIILSLFSMVCATTLLFSQQTINDENVQKRDVSSFHAIDVATGIQLLLTEGNAEEVAVSAATIDFRDKIVTKIENGVLKIYYENKLKSMNSKKEKKNLKAYVSYKNLDGLFVTTGAIVKIDGVLKSDKLKMKANTGAEIMGAIDVKELFLSQNTGSLVTLTGNCEEITVDGDTGSMFKGAGLNSNTCNASVSTGAGISIIAKKAIYAKANTGGYVKYSGDASVREIKTNTGGTVKKI